MLELLFRGFFEWIYGLILECWEYFSSVLFDLMSLDFAYLETYMPIITTIRQIMLGVGWALLLGNLVFQATRSMMAGVGFEADDPKLLFTRTFVFSFLLVVSPQICDVCLNMTSVIIDMVQMPDAATIKLPDADIFAGLTASWLLVIICGLIVMFQSCKLFFEMAERYFILAVLTIMAPLAFGVGGSRSTSDIFSGWCRMRTHVFLRWPMYDHEYEWQILGFLRMLKYIWLRNKSILADLVRDYRCGEIDTEDIFELSVMLLVEYICVDYLPEDDPNDFYGEEYTCYLLMESELDDFLTLIAQIETLRFRTTECTGRNKLRDAVEMFMGDVLYDFKIVPCEAGCVIYLWPPPDYYDPIEFANSIIDLMAYIGAEIDRMKAELAALTAAEQEMEVAA